MTKIKSVADLKIMRDKLQARLKPKKQNDASGHIQVKVAMATCGIASGAKTVMEFMASELEKRNIEAQIVPTGCMGYCYAEPTVEVTIPGREPVVFGFVDIRKADMIIEKYIKNGELIEGIIPENYETI